MPWRPCSTALLGAADVALTEALVGTLLSTTLYAVALRSSMVLRLGCRDPQALPPALLDQLRRWLEPASLRLELLAQPASPAKGSLPAESADLHGLLEWRADTGSLARLFLISASLRQRLAALPPNGDWQPLLLPLEAG
ncbi:MAG: hydrogenase subunit MbhD domain-containing protein [Cyanobium sp.]